MNKEEVKRKKEELVNFEKKGKIIDILLISHNKNAFLFLIAPKSKFPILNSLKFFHSEYSKRHNIK